MGRDKARLPFRGGDLVERGGRARWRRAAGNVTLVGHSELPAIPDRYPGEGPLGGILTALHHTSADWNLIVACDMPEVSADFLGELLARGRAVATPTSCFPTGRTDCPNRSARSTTGAPCRPWKTHFARGVRKVTAALEGLAVERLAVAELSLFQNVNTPEDWAAYAAE